MVDRLAWIRERADPEAMYYLNQRMIPRLRALAAGELDPVKREVLRFRLGRQWVFAGHPSRGIEELEALASGVGGEAGRGIPAAEFRLQLAVAYLRLGELENCVDGHNPESCLMPIQGNGVHRHPRGSKAAMRVLEEQLRVSPGDLRARWLLNVAAMTLGEWPAGVPEPWRIPPDVFVSERDLGRFPDVAPALGLDVHDLAGGCAIDDFDGDGLLEVVVTSWSLDGPMHFFHRRADGVFEDRAAAAGLTGLVGGLNLQQTDYNNDGHLDLWVLRGGWFGKAGRIPNSLLRNNGDGTFSDVTEEAGLLSFHPTQTSAWLDFDGDGWLDVFIGNETWDPQDPDPCELYRNNRDGTFSECAAEVGLAVSALVKGVAAGDYDQDGRPDLYLSCLDGPNLLFRNMGPAPGRQALASGAAGPSPWRFRNVSAMAGVDETLHSFPTWFFDFDNDGDEDLFVCGYQMRDVGDVAADYLGLRHTAARPRLYQNLGDGRFTNVTAAAGLDRLCHAMGSNYGDLDGDGRLDIFLGTGDPDLATLIPNRVFRNGQGGRFEEITTSAGFGNLQKGHGVAFADLDQDGDQDVYVVLGGAYPVDRYPNALYLNPGHGAHWIELRCEGVRANRAAIGARIAITSLTPSGRRTVWRTVGSGGSFGASPLRQQVGLGEATSIQEVSIRWPGSGLPQRFTGLSLNRVYLLREGEPQPQQVASAPVLVLPAVEAGADRKMPAVTPKSAPATPKGVSPRTSPGRGDD